MHLFRVGRGDFRQGPGRVVACVARVPTARCPAETPQNGCFPNPPCAGQPDRGDFVASCWGKHVSNKRFIEMRRRSAAWSNAKRCWKTALSWGSVRMRGKDQQNNKCRVGNEIARHNLRVPSIWFLWGTKASEGTNPDGGKVKRGGELIPNTEIKPQLMDRTNVIETNGDRSERGRNQSNFDRNRLTPGRNQPRTRCSLPLS